MSVVFPAPFFPSTAVTRPFWTSRSTPSSACTAPKRLESPTTRMPAAATLGPGRGAGPARDGEAPSRTSRGGSRRIGLQAASGTENRRPPGPAPIRERRCPAIPAVGGYGQAPTGDWPSPGGVSQAGLPRRRGRRLLGPHPIATATPYGTAPTGGRIGGSPVDDLAGKWRPWHRSTRRARSQPRSLGSIQTLRGGLPRPG